MDDPQGYKLSKAEIAATQAGMIPLSTSIEPSPAKSAKKAWLKSSKGEGPLTVTFLAEGFTYSDPSFVKDMTDALILQADHKRLNEIGLVQSAE